MGSSPGNGQKEMVGKSDYEDARMNRQGSQIGRNIKAEIVLIFDPVYSGVQSGFNHELCVPKYDTRCPAVLSPCA